MSRFLSGAICALFICSISGNAMAAYNGAAGKTVYDANCGTCHNTGMMGAPKLGDKTGWAPRIATGVPALVAHSVNGYTGKKGMMPAKGGNPKLTATQVGDAVQYMVDKSK
ncbi:MAG: cytochrome c5 family protein [Chlorobiaceae bacterium]|jgi:cytochrome c5|nr:cytochrome c5 family protein [Chlorobiaceae bacterium]